MKLVTTLFALETLGPEFQFKTRFMLGEGQLKDGTLSAAICVEASGDPTFASTRFDSDPIAALADRIALLGASNWNGGLGLCAPDDSPLLGPGWSWDDAGTSYTARPSQFIAFENKFTLRLASDGARVIERGNTLAGLGFQLVTHFDDEADDLSCRRAPLSPQVVCTLPKRATVFDTEVTVDEPMLLVARSLEAALAERGITWTSKPFTREGSWTLLHEVESPPLRDIARVTNQASINLFAEGLALAAVRDHSYAAWQREAADWLIAQGITANDVTLSDGSGLSHYNALSADAVVRLLQAAAHKSVGPAFFSSLAISGTSGTLKRRGLAVRGDVFAKSGTVSHHRALAGIGYLQGRGAVFFAMLVANHPGSVTDTNQVLDSFMSAMLLR
jgi:D-alanyl-D-alanine carboxypeptidase/D-alanyl-D-alanine-endopeptidase (penicillin-binding protein 4)